jgi:hypothetical protein
MLAPALCCVQVGYDQEVVHYYEPLYKNQRQAVIDLMASDKAPE